MSETVPTSILAERLSPNQARLVLAFLIVLGSVLAGVSLGITGPVKRSGPTDLDTYQRVVEALRAGQDYYAALHAALLEGGYGTLSPLNWRLPGFLTVV